MSVIQEPSSGPAPPIIAVVVTYQPGKPLVDHLRGLARQARRVLVVDNGSQGTASAVIDAAERLSNVQVIRNRANLGIGAALNVGIKQALQIGCDWVATFDQDSTILEGYFNSLLAAWRACPERSRVGMIVPGGWSGEPNSDSRTSQPTSPEYALTHAAVTSGSLLRADIFATTGFYDEPMFIDYVDTEFCLRVQRAGLLVVSAPRVVLPHELGDRQTRRFPGFQLTYRVHAAWRYYYIMRNRLLVFRRYVSQFPRPMLHDALNISWEMGRMALLEEGRLSKLKCALHGIWDGLRGRSGRHPQYPPAHTQA